jgi:hypothetical protein
MNGAFMAAQSGIVVPAKKIANWREEDARLELEISERIQRRAELRRKLEAADILSEDTNEEARSHPETPPLAADGEDETDSVAGAFVANLRKTGDSLKVQQAKQRLIEIGFKSEANRKNYIYGLLYRLTKSGKLLKRGSKYRAAPISSPEGETAATGAAVRH